MHEREKLRESGYFLGRMQVLLNEPGAFQYELSAFLSAARSVLQYAYEEAVQTPNGRQWYESQVSGNMILRFFKNKRDLNIHAQPVRPSRQISVSITEHINVSEAIRITIQKVDGTTEVHEHADPPVQKTEEPSAEMTVRYIFSDWSGSGDVIEISRQYLTMLESFVQAGLTKGVISG